MLHVECGESCSNEMPLCKRESPPEVIVDVPDGDAHSPVHKVNIKYLLKYTVTFKASERKTISFMS